MNRYVTVLFAVTLVGTFFISCSQPSLSSDPPSPIQISLASPSPTESIEETLPPSTPIIDTSISGITFTDLSDTVFVFSGGAGAWSTEVKISFDGTFSGYYSDLDMGDSGQDYPNGTQYVCSFSGKFSSLKKTGDYEYSMKCESITQEGSVNEVKFGEDGLRYITSEPYGFENADEFILYLPGKKIDELPDGFTSWVGISQDSDNESIAVLDFYGLYNVGGEDGFSS